MFSNWKKLSIAAMFASAVVLVSAQEPNPTSVAPGAHSGAITQGPNGTYIYHVQVVQRELDGVNYINRNGATHVGFVGTELAPNARGEAKVESVTGKTKISAKFEGLTPANGFGPEYLTYVLWAISADGRPENLGELELSGNKANLDVSSSFQSFGLIVTAEPYFSVSTPSDVIVLKNVFTDKTNGVLESVNVHYSLLPKGLYAPTGGANSIWNPVTDREHYPLALYEAHNAARIARAAGADRYAADIMREVDTDLQNADGGQSAHHRDVHMIFTEAREATQRAEDARITTLRKQADERARQQEADKQQGAATRLRSRRLQQRMLARRRMRQPQPRRKLTQPAPARKPMPPTLVRRQPKRSMWRSKASRMRLLCAKNCASS